MTLYHVTEYLIENYPQSGIFTLDGLVSYVRGSHRSLSLEVYPVQLDTLGSTAPPGPLDLHLRSSQPGYLDSSHYAPISFDNLRSIVLHHDYNEANTDAESDSD